MAQVVATLSKTHKIAPLVSYAYIRAFSLYAGKKRNKWPVNDRCVRGWGRAGFRCCQMYFQNASMEDRAFFKQL